MTRRRVLFVSHEASRTGAPAVLLTLMQWLRSNSDLEFDVLMRQGGPLEPEFTELAPTSVYELDSKPGTYIVRGVLRRAGFGSAASAVHRRRVASRISRRKYGLVYSNTITNGLVVEHVAARGVPVLTHVHELETVIRSFGAENLAAVKRQTARYVCASSVVLDNLVARHGVDPSDCEVVYEFVDTATFAELARSSAREEVRRSLGIQPGAAVVGGSGTTDWRKGPDLFIQLARAVRSMNLPVPVHFLWAGGADPGSMRHDELMHDVEILGLRDAVRFLGAYSHPSPYFAAFDVFTLVSREDPFPLVCLEAAVAGCPVLCFAGAGGMPEFVEDDSGFVVPYLNIDAMAKRIAELVLAPDFRVRLGRNAARKTLTRHDVGTVAPRLLSIMESMIHGS